MALTYNPTTNSYVDSATGATYSAFNPNNNGGISFNNLTPGQGQQIYYATGNMGGGAPASVSQFSGGNNVAYKGFTATPGQQPTAAPIDLQTHYPGQTGFMGALNPMLNHVVIPGLAIAAGAYGAASGLGALAGASGAAGAAGGYNPALMAANDTGTVSDVGNVWGGGGLTSTAAPYTGASGVAGLSASGAGASAASGGIPGMVPSWADVASSIPAASSSGGISGALSSLNGALQKYQPLLSLGGSVLNAVTGSNAAKSAADAQVQASNNANQTLQNMYTQNRADLAPYRAAGNNALGAIQTGLGIGGQVGNATAGGARLPGQSGASYGDLNRPFTLQDFYQNDPGYQFRMDQGMTALQSSAAARGGLLNGGTLKDITNYAQGQASNEYGNAYGRFTNDQTNRFNRLASVAGLGQNAVGTGISAGQSTAQGVAGNQTGIGNAQAAGTIGSANAISGGVNNLNSQLLLNSMLQQQSRNNTASSYGG